MHFIKFILYVAIGMVVLSSCDTREDYFFEHSEEPIISLVSDHDSTIDGKRYIYVELSWGDTIEIDYQFIDPYKKISDFKTEVKPRINNRSDFYYWKDLAEVGYESEDVTYWSFDTGKEYDYTQFANHLSVQIDTVRNKLLLIESTQSAQEFYKKSARTQIKKDADSIAIDAIITVSAANALGKYGSSNILMTLYKNRPPTATCSVSSVPGHPMHKEITIHGSDPDNDEINKYEYCIDGKLFKNNSGYASSNVPDEGKGAYNGTYVTGINLSSIKHAFQDYGEHIIHVRCRDSWGNWSCWYSQTITITE